MEKGLTAIVAAGLITLGGITYSQEKSIKSIDTTIDTIQTQTSINDTSIAKQDTSYYEGDFNGDGKLEKLKIIKGITIDVERLGGPAGNYNIKSISIIKEGKKHYIRLEYLDEDMKKKIVKIEYDGEIWVITPTR